MKKMKDLIISLQSRDIIFELLASNADEQIAAHEVLHSIRLDHTFEKNSDDFIYKGEQTDNVMDYDHNDQKFFNKYQIDIMQSETKKYYAKK